MWSRLNPIQHGNECKRHRRHSSPEQRSQNLNDIGKVLASFAKAEDATFAVPTSIKARPWEQAST